MLIENNIPLPTNRISWPFDQMEVGDSFLCPPGGELRIRAIAADQKVRKNRVFTVRKTEEGLRCWRIS